jgi:hypothetical protein
MKQPTTLKTVAKKLKPKTVAVPTNDDPREELKRLVRLHNTHTRNSVALHHMGSDRKNLETGEVIPCRLPIDGVGGQLELIEMSENQKKAATKLEHAIEVELRKLPVYQLFLKHVYGVGPVVAGYLCAYIDIHRSAKPSQLQRYCGVAVIDGRFERRSSGPKYDPSGKLSPDAGGTFNQEIRTRLFQAFSSMWRTKGDGSSKYLDRWRDVKARSLVDERVKDGRIKVGESDLSINGHAHSKGWHAAAQLLVYDLYLAWRAIEGLPSWTTWYEWARGYEHGTAAAALPRENVPRMLTVEQALDIVGNVGKTQMQHAAE